MYLKSNMLKESKTSDYFTTRQEITEIDYH